MKDEKLPAGMPIPGDDTPEPMAALQRALYHWERQPPHAQTGGRFTSKHRQASSRDDPFSEPDLTAKMDGSGATGPNDSALEDGLRRQVARLAALERIIPNDRRLDPPRFSLMMLNAFLGRAVTDGDVLNRLPGLFSISERIDAELGDLERAYPQALEPEHSEPEPSPRDLRNEMRAMLAEIKASQTVQQRQMASSLSTLHAAISDLRAQLPDIVRPARADPASVTPPVDPPMPKVNAIAEPLVDPERLVDPRPVLAAARAAASRVHLEADDTGEPASPAKPKSADRAPFRSILIGSAVIGTLMMLFGRDAVQFLASSPLHAPLARH